MTTATPTLTAPERLWRGATGDAYWADPRHSRLSPQRAAFWREWAQLLDPRAVLEVGCGTGGNLGAFPRATTRVGLDVSEGPLRDVGAQGRGLPVAGSVGRLPLKSRAFDLVVSAGCLIHVPWEQLARALFEIGRVAARDVLLLEYDDGTAHAPPWDGAGGAHKELAPRYKATGTGEREIPWRGHRGVLWARPYGYLFWRTRADFSPMLRADLGPADGWDRVTLAWFRRRAGT